MIAFAENAESGSRRQAVLPCVAVEDLGIDLDRFMAPVGIRKRPGRRFGRTLEIQGFRCVLFLRPVSLDDSSVRADLPLVGDFELINRELEVGPLNGKRSERQDS